jgi:hypothetical protein
LRVALVQSQRGHECRRAAGRNAGALFMSEDGLHGLRPDRSRCAAGLVASYEQAAVVIGPAHPGLSSGPRETRAPRGQQCVRGPYVMFVSEFDQASTSCFAWSFASPYRS